MSQDAIGQACALGAAMMWAFALVMFKRSGEAVPPLPLNLFKNTVSLILLSLTLLVAGDSFADLDQQSSEDLWVLLASGLIGIAIADTLLFASLNMIGVGLLAIVECLYSPMILGFSWVMLSTSLTGWSVLGGLLILAAVLVTAGVKTPGLTPRRLLSGLMVGALAILFMTFGIVWAKPALDRFPLIWATTLRLFAGTVSLMAYAAVVPSQRKQLASLKPSKTWATMLPGSVLGGYVCYIMWVAGFKYAKNPTVPAILNQTSTVFALILATLILHEPFTRRKTAAVVMALSGVALVLVGEQI